MAGESERKNVVQEILCDIGMVSLYEQFIKQKIDNLETCKALTDGELKTLGLQTIGDRARFRERIVRQTVVSSSSVEDHQDTSRRNRGNIELDFCFNRDIFSLNSYEIKKKVSLNTVSHCNVRP